MAERTHRTWINTHGYRIANYKAISNRPSGARVAPPSSSRETLSKEDFNARCISRSPVRRCGRCQANTAERSRRVPPRGVLDPRQSGRDPRVAARADKYRRGSRSPDAPDLHLCRSAWIPGGGETATRATRELCDRRGVHTRARRGAAPERDEGQYQVGARVFQRISARASCPRRSDGVREPDGSREPGGGHANGWSEELKLEDRMILVTGA